MTIYRAIKREKAKAEEYRAMSSEGNAEIAEIYIRCSKYHEQLSEWLEELKKYKEKPEGYLWDEAVQQGYNKALDDFVNACEKQFTTMYGQRYVDMRDIKNIEEQLKAGGNINE